MFDKITSRISKLCYKLNMDFVDPVSLSCLGPNVNMSDGHCSLFFPAISATSCHLCIMCKTVNISINFD